MDVVNTTGQDSHFQVGVGGRGGVIQKPTGPVLQNAKQMLLKAHQKAKLTPMLTEATILFAVSGKTVTADVPAGADSVELVEKHGIFSVVVHHPPQRQPPVRTR